MLIYSLIFKLLSNAVTSRRDKSILFSRASMLVLLFCSFIALSGTHFTSLGRGIGLFGGLFNATSITHVFQIFIFIISTVILQLTSFHPRKVFLNECSSLTSILRVKFDNSINNIKNKMGEQFKIIEYPLIILFIITGATFLVSTSDLVSIFLSIELQSYGLYLISTIYRNSESATNGGLTYFLLGGLSSCFILLGTSLLYSNSGSTNMDSLYVITSLSDMAIDNATNIYKSDYIHMSLLILSVGFLFKVSAAPFHF
jgi:NADH-ubiquinone oxidoreductase chain 2